MANRTLNDFPAIVQTAAHKKMRTYNNTIIPGHLNSGTKEELHMQLFPNS